MSSNIALTGLAKDLAARAASGKPVRIGLIGSGEMGTDIVTRAAMMDGVEVAAISELNIPNAHRAVSISHQEDGHSTDAATTDAINAAIESGKTAITDNTDALIDSGLIDVVIDATGVPAVGAEIGLRAMERGKHLVMMNVEADVTIGSYLRREAERLGVIYSLGAGDEPSSCMELIEFVSAMGHKIVCAGKGKNNPLNIDATPDAYEAEAKARHMNPRLLVEFVDGSKTAVEMAAIGNATGLIPDVDGMHGPAAGPKELAKVLIPEKDGGILSGIGRVDYSIGKGVSPGVFVIAEAEHPRIHERMADLKMGDGPYYEFIRPYHLTSLEVPLTCARAVLYGKADMVPLDKPVVEVCAVAKRDLKPGETLDQIGEYTYRAWAMEVSRAQAARALPAGMLTGATVTAPIRKGELVTGLNAKLPNTRIVELRKRQDEMIYGKDLING
ncbi:putative homoserine dehydrogenase-like protein [Defluviimonas denitrificans]|jgi:predicted homoserine dehydrogenase-like protein|uniref:Putative homoserine dehydrogenase-like protein n=1 Tax=Albidovulum denitrificans TaxID=404881 RepID=A0A2S8RYW8_9RHOB|nr:SAF domain-containing protein [Defluviimonas denitrificans]PQV53747.1 putative homoserine dehydrogenase-like protein [Defluviimonas denitrificans]